MQAMNFVSNYGQNTYARYPYTSANGITGTCNTGLLTNMPTGGGVQVWGAWAWAGMGTQPAGR